MQDLGSEELHHRVGDKLDIRRQADMLVQRETEPRCVGDWIVKELVRSIGGVVSSDDVHIIPGFPKICQGLLVTVRVSTDVGERLSKIRENKRGGEAI